MFFRLSRDREPGSFAKSALLKSVGDYSLDVRASGWLNPTSEPDIEPFPNEGPELEAPWENPPMTLCLAAACQQDRNDRIVLCSDWKSGSSLGSSQTSDKLRWLKKKPNWIALTAGKEKAVESIIRRYRTELASSGDINDSNAEMTFGRIAQRHLLQKKSDCVETEIGVTYGYFRKHLEEFPDKVQVRLFERITRVDLEVRAASKSQKYNNLKQHDFPLAISWRI
jgi:hypothetical protein